jgi:acyl dehydratase
MITYTEYFYFSQDDVNNFTSVIKDDNPLHYCKKHAHNTRFKTPILPGLLSISVFSKIFGNNREFPNGIYVSHNIKFLKPMYIETEYKAVVVLLNLLDKNKAELLTDIFEKKTNIKTVTGLAILKSDIFNHTRKL